MVARQFDVFPNPDPLRRRQIPFFAVLQHDLHGEMHTVVVAPIYPLEKFRPIERLTPVVEIEGQRYCLAVSELAFVPRRFVKGPVASIGSVRDKIIGALDVLFEGV